MKYTKLMYQSSWNQFNFTFNEIVFHYAFTCKMQQKDDESGGKMKN